VCEKHAQVNVENLCRFLLKMVTPTTYLTLIAMSDLEVDYVLITLDKPHSKEQS